jgi:hypothetical protein
VPSTYRPIACDKPGTAITPYLVSLPFSMLLCGRIVVCAASLLQAWECGVASDTDPEWRARAVELRAYHRQHGDTSVGHRDGDDQDLARYARACCCHLPCVYAGRRRGTVARLHCHADIWFAHLAFKRQVTLCAVLRLQATVQSSGTCVHMLLGLHYMKVVSVSSHCWTPGSSRRWVTAQRRAMSAGLLSGDKLELLQELAFEPDEDEAEWLRWFMDLARCAFQKARRAGGRAGRRAGGRARGRAGGRAGGRGGGGDIGGPGGGAGRTVGRREGGRGEGGGLSGDKLELLQELAFEPDEDEAEWLRWFMDLARCGPPSIPPFLSHVLSLFTSANGCAGQMGLARLPPSVCLFLLSSLPSLSA